MASPLPSLFLLAFLLLCSAPFSLSDSTTECVSQLGILQPCVPFVSTNNSSIPSTCCNPLQSVLSNSTQFNCLCTLIANPTYGSQIQAALKLPKECNLTIVADESNCTSTSSSNTGGTPASPSSNLATSIAYPLTSLIVLCALSLLFL